MAKIQTTEIHLYTTPQYRDRIKKFAVENGQTMASYIMTAIAMRMAEDRKKK